MDTHLATRLLRLRDYRAAIVMTLESLLKLTNHAAKELEGLEKDLREGRDTTLPEM